MSCERGFTIIELITTTAIVAILAVTAVSSYKLYQKDAYDAHAVSMIDDGALAIEAGINGMPNDTGMYVASSDASGNLQGNDVAKMMPGVSVSPDLRMWAMLDMGCAAGLVCPKNVMCCAEVVISAYHCKGSSSHVLLKWNDGRITRSSLAWPGGARC